MLGYGSNTCKLLAQIANVEQRKLQQHDGQGKCSQKCMCVCAEKSTLSGQMRSNTGLDVTNVTTGTIMTVLV